MSLHVLDTDVISLFQHGHPAVTAAVQRHPLSDIAITVLTVEEQLSGWYAELRNAKKPAALAAVYQRMALTVRFLGHLPILPLTEPAINPYEDLQRLKLKVKKMDLRIAAVVLEHGAVLVTRNTRDFSRIRGLQIEDWSK